MSDYKSLISEIVERVKASKHPDANLAWQLLDGFRMPHRELAKEAQADIWKIDTSADPDAVTVQVMELIETHDIGAHYAFDAAVDAEIAKDGGESEPMTKGRTWGGEQ